jgi:hypothetical protein
MARNVYPPTFHSGSALTVYFLGALPPVDILEEVCALGMSGISLFAQCSVVVFDFACRNMVYGIGERGTTIRSRMGLFNASLRPNLS